MEGDLGEWAPRAGSGALVRRGGDSRARRLHQQSAWEKAAVYPQDWGEGPHQDPPLLGSWSQTASCQNCEIQMSVCKPPGSGVSQGPRNSDTSPDPGQLQVVVCGPFWHIVSGALLHGPERLLCCVWTLRWLHPDLRVSRPTHWEERVYTLLLVYLLI